MTNREWLMEQMQNMSDEELGAILDLSEHIKKECYDCCDTSITCDKCNAHWLKAEHKEKIKLSEAERVILENIPKEYKWMARDEDGRLYIFIQKPYKVFNNDNYWAVQRAGTETFLMLPYNHLFQFIKWEDAEAYNIEALLKGE